MPGGQSEEQLQRRHFWAFTVHGHGSCDVTRTLARTPPSGFGTHAPIRMCLRSPWVLKWFALNKEVDHPKLIPIPLGLKPEKVPTILQFHNSSLLTSIEAKEPLLYKVRQFGRDWCDRWYCASPHPV